MFDKPAIHIGGEGALEGLKFLDSVTFDDQSDMRETITVSVGNCFVKIKTVCEYYDVDNHPAIENTAEHHVELDIHHIDAVLELLLRVKAIAKITEQEGK